MLGSALVPLIHVPESPSLDLSKSLVGAFQSSGFALVTTPLVSPELQTKALRVAKDFFASDNNIIERHPVDPKRYCMLESQNEALNISPDLAEYYQALEQAKISILECIAVGLEMDSQDYLSRLHSKNNSCMRLLQYPPGSGETGNRCKAHSDYGTITLLSTDGVSGLELWHEDEWKPVPYVPGALVVNVGSLLSDWTRGSLLATLHRVAGPASQGTSQSTELLTAVQQARISIAFFADPDPHVATLLSESVAGDQRQENMSVAEYIQWRSGGTDENRSGVPYTAKEEDRVTKDSKTIG